MTVSGAINGWEHEAPRSRAEFAVTPASNAALCTVSCTLRRPWPSALAKRGADAIGPPSPRLDQTAWDRPLVTRDRRENRSKVATTVAHNRQDWRCRAATSTVEKPIGVLAPVGEGQ
jgi:hypothetical protein